MIEILSKNIMDKKKKIQELNTHIKDLAKNQN